MNKRILELAIKAGINLTPAQFSGVLEDEVSEFDLEKFAELIVRECAKVVFDKTGPKSALNVLDHFGVEE
jgi:hypothetical protein